MSREQWGDGYHKGYAAGKKNVGKNKFIVACNKEHGWVSWAGYLLARHGLNEYEYEGIDYFVLWRSCCDGTLFEFNDDVVDLAYVQREEIDTSKVDLIFCKSYREVVGLAIRKGYGGYGVDKTNAITIESAVMK